LMSATPETPLPEEHNHPDFPVSIQRALSSIGVKALRPLRGLYAVSTRSGLRPSPDPDA
jgi:hypothetical protein